jgi:osmotically-inducible protein OsmY
MTITPRRIGRLVMIRVSVGIAVLLASTTSVESMAQAQPAEEPQPQSAPPTAIDREENNPAKAAARVSEALKREQAEASQDISVTTHAGTMVVSGEVGSEVAAAKARSTAEKAAEGSRVSTNIGVKEAAPSAVQVEAARLARNVEDALKNDKRTASLGVTVSVDEEQRIGLHGLVPTRESRALAESVASKAAGPKHIRNHLVIPGG